MSTGPWTRFRIRISAVAGTLTLAAGLAVFAYIYRRKKEKARRLEAIEEELRRRNYDKNKAKTLAPKQDDANVEGVKNGTVNGNAEITGKPAASSSNVSQSAGPVNPLLQERRVELEMKVPKEEVPALIGKGGANIRKIQHDTNTRINPRVLDNGDRILFISGLPDDVEEAERKIQRHLLSQPVVSTLELMVPDRMLGRIIGRGGERIKAIQDASSARVDIPRPVADSQMDSTEYQYNEDGDVLRVVKIRGSEDQIQFAKKLILDEVEQDMSQRNRIKRAAANRPPRVQLNANVPKTTGLDDFNNEEIIMLDNSLKFTLRSDQTMEVYVSCVYHPNSFYVQVVTRDFGELDRVCDELTTYYSKNPRQEKEQLYIGDMVGAYFELDEKWHRAKILDMTEKGIEVIYVDFGDKRTLSKNLVRKLEPQFLRLRFQAIELTLNLECPDESWSDESINTFVNLVGSGQWNLIFKAKVVQYLKVEDRDVLWVELIGRENLSIGEELVLRGLAEKPSDSDSVNGNAAAEAESISSSSSSKSFSEISSEPAKPAGNSEESQAA